MSTRQKRIEHLKVDGSEVSGDFDASVDFTSDVISFPDRNSGWSCSVDGWSGVTAGTPTLSFLASNKADGDFNEYKTVANLLDLKDTANRNNFDDVFPFKYMKVKYVSGGSTGTFSVTLAK